MLKPIIPLVLLAALLLSGCGATPEATAPAAATDAPAAATDAPAAATDAPAAAATDAPAAAATNAPAAASEEPFVFGMVLVGPISDKGWSQAHYEAAKQVEERLPGSKFVYIDKVNPADRPNVQVEQVVDDLVSQGARLIITNSDDFKDGTRAAAQSHPEVTFIHASGDDVLTGKAPANLGNLMGQMEYGKMMAGCAAALQTKTGKIAYLGPLINDETRRLVNAAYLGARHCWTEVLGKPTTDLKFNVTWIGFWFNIPGVTLDPTKVATDFISSDYDVTLSGIDTPEAITEAGKASAAGKQVFAVPYDFRGACEIAAAACLGTPYFNWLPDYLRLVSAARDGTWKQAWEWKGPDWKNINDAESSMIGFVPGNGLSAESQQKLDSFITGLGDGSISLWRGPLKFQDGTDFLKDGETATDKQIWYMPQLLEGIEGQSAAQ